MNNTKIVEDLKKYNWKFIIGYGRSLDQLNDRQLRFIKGFVCEELIAMEDDQLECVREDHKDFQWHKHNVSVELKSQLSMSMYKGNGSLRKTFIVKFTNSNGTNNKDTLDPNSVCDYTLVLRNDGSFLVDKSTVLKKLIKTGDGFDLKLEAGDLIEISGHVVDTAKYDVDLDKVMMAAIREAIKKGKSCLTE